MAGGGTAGGVDWAHPARCHRRGSWRTWAFLHPRILGRLDSLDLDQNQSCTIYAHRSGRRERIPPLLPDNGEPLVQPDGGPCRALGSLILAILQRTSQSSAIVRIEDITPKVRTKGPFSNSMRRLAARARCRSILPFRASGDGRISVLPGS